MSARKGYPSQMGQRLTTPLGAAVRTGDLLCYLRAAVTETADTAERIADECRSDYAALEDRVGKLVGGVRCLMQKKNPRPWPERATKR